MYSKTMLVVRDVPVSSAWYQRLLGLTSGHGGDQFEMLMDGNELVLMLHHFDAKEHPSIADSSGTKAGAGVLLYFYADDVDAAYGRALEMNAEVVDEPHVNEIARQYEFSLKDPDGYALTVCRLRVT